MSTCRVRIDTLYRGLFDGPHATPKPSTEGPIYLGIGNITEDGKLDLADVRHIAEEDYEAWTKRVVPQAGDIVFTYEATLNRYAMIPKKFRGCLGRRTALIRPNHLAVNPRFLFYYFFSEDWRSTVQKNIMSGATVDRIPLTLFPAFCVNLPQRGVQDRIASILSAYDDLIENNARRIKILEEMAQMLYREWFVNFRFPGHENVRTVESESGPIPEGWSVGTISQIAILHREGINPADLPDELFLHFSIPSFDNSRTPVTEKGAAIKSNKYRVVPGCVLLSKLNPRIPRLWMPSLGGGLREITSTEFMVLTPPVALHRTYLFEFLSSEEFTSALTGRSLGTSTSHQRVKPDDFLNLPSLVPPRWAMDEFCRNVDPMMDEISVLRNKNTNLRTTREILLPKLISGEIPVEAADEHAAKLMERTA